MKKIILLVCCMMFFSITASKADAKVDMIKGCWRYQYGAIKGEQEIGDNYIKNLKNGDKYELILEETDTHFIMRMTHQEIKKHAPDYEEVFYINRESITETSFWRSKKASSPEEGLKFTRIQCPK